MCLNLAKAMVDRSDGVGMLMKKRVVASLSGLVTVGSFGSTNRSVVFCVHVRVSDRVGGTGNRRRLIKTDGRKWARVSPREGLNTI